MINRQAFLFTASLMNCALNTSETKWQQDITTCKLEMASENPLPLPKGVKSEKYQSQFSSLCIQHLTGKFAEGDK